MTRAAMWNEPVGLRVVSLPTAMGYTFLTIPFSMTANLRSGMLTSRRRLSSFWAYAGKLSKGTIAMAHRFLSLKFQLLFDVRISFPLTTACGVSKCMGRTNFEAQKTRHLEQRNQDGSCHQRHAVSGAPQRDE